MNRNIFRIILTTLVIVLFLLIFGKYSEGSELSLKGEYYEKDGCVYLIGNPTEGERTEDLRLYKERMAKHRKLYDRERARVLKSRSVKSQREHEIALAEIYAKAMEDERIAEETYLKGLIKEGVGETYIENNNTANGGYSYSEGGSGGSATTGTITNTNSATGGSGGTSTHNDY